MAVGKRNGSHLKLRDDDLEDEQWLVFVRYSGGLWKRKIGISRNEDLMTPSKKRFGERMIVESDKSLLEALPQEMLMKVLCCVNHDDLKRLLFVSKSISEATVIAKETHFMCTSPSKVSPFRPDFDEIQTPHAPMKEFKRPKLDEDDLAHLRVALFSSPDENKWPRKKLFMETEI